MNYMDRFIINYNGNKYAETKKHLKDLDVSNYHYICEPFCGIFGFSRYMSLTNFRGQFLLNDIDSNLIDFYNGLKTDFDGTLEKYETESAKNEKKKSYILGLIGRAQFNIFNDKKCLSKFENFKKMKDKYVPFLDRCVFSCLPYDKFIDTLKPTYGTDKTYLLFFDPPYIYSHNSTYIYTESFDKKTEHLDESDIYVNLLEYFNNWDSILITNKLSILHYLFKAYTFKEYSGKYQRTKNIKVHIIYKSF